MKFLLLALLSCICSADDRRLRSIKQWARKIDISKTDSISRIPLLNKYVDLMTDAVRLRHYDNRMSVRLSHFHNELPHPIRHRRHQSRSIEPNGLVHHLSWPVKKEAVVEGDLVLGGLMMVHEREDTVTCGPVMPQGGIQALEAMLYTLDILNQREIVPGVKIGAHILDDCDKDTYGLEMAVDFIKGSISNIDGAEYHCNKTAVRKVISGVVGAASSVTSIQVANLLRLFKIPQVSFFSTSPELSNKQRFEYFSRTIPSDHYQVKAMVDIVLSMGWSYVSIIYEESNYGVKAFEELEELLGKYNICIAIKEKLVKDSGVAEEVAYDEIVSKLLTKSRARGCIIFGSDQEVAGVMRAVRRRKATGVFSWIGSDGWSARGLVSNGNEPEVEGTLSVQPQANPVKGFEEYFLNLTVENNRRNPWFVEFWEDHFKCQYPNAPRTPYNVNYTKNCTTKERLTKQNTEFEDQLQFVSDAVMAFAYAFRDMHTDLCHGKAGLCDEMKPINGTLLLQYLRHVDFEGLSGDKFKFDKDGDGPARYNIIHFKQTEAGKYKWIRVGKYLEGELRLNMSEIQFKLGHPQPPESVCSLPCEVGQAKKYVEGERCCWHCFNCTQYQIRHSEDETQCMQCERGTLPDETHSICREVPEEFLRPESGWAIGAMSFSATGMLVTLFVCGVFLKHNDTPVVRASGRELSYVLLSGILLCYLVTFTLIFKPTHIVCGIQRFAAGFCFTVVYAALLTKTNRISRIFNAGSAKRPSFISPRSQLIICSGLISVQILINIVWMIIDPARAMHHYPTMEDNLLVCNNYIDTSYMIAFTYPIILIIVCTIYAILTRKIPEAFNESKHIGLTMYTTCVIWLAFVPLYYGTGSNVALRITSMSVTISLSASVTVVCLFSPKLYIILIRPERNVRPTVRAGRPNPTKSSAITATNASSMIGPVTATTVLTAATCDQNKAIKKHIASTMDCSTQSECYEMETKERKNGDSVATCISRSTQTTVNEKEFVAVVTSNKKSPDVIVSANNMESINNTTTKRINSNARIGNGPLSQSDVSL
ncbi:PREDICTED: metabotropic glutamate receptor 2 isoform X2 [Acromyrmex echinatior]|uniref:metabotropic glutamate receptor 2 isoform X2 n=1 Tax=Acromyrmex echinatior TaxID=103372 RepID=UPI000581062A|nr:PREDICTED: metabotropic glutamate receptor 2 isoform X2 [Acromyrmex echinatior]XP_011049693.1 PREDICTED: metabotropic glutamate receptor 2 isoform X2 [Acromyrmex echinatior]XP_011049694.1 PREDICTED: metabotropic glutamate receptor 2 isoform X2 [Acromyrmex echinatior]XP_011049695.1 PREDICTED: metabotropic glutamate receptor 2 isoform X2 [Acromyrmex echinatior]XP_011049696.1 PREDICTED: metabotropic glutamate receptor 2 isoform X2 [Acromyrmex echinatior]XP_011049697.1 PREDICTED: metabotropic g